MVTDLLVAGLDLETGLEVDIGDREVWNWHRKGHNGDRTLVCRHCYEGADLTGGPRMVALVPRGRQGGKRRPHFAHPPGLAPLGGKHSPESLWHATAKQRLRRWAVGLGALARVEAYTPDGRRRSDVAVTLPGGGRVAFEVQFGEISDTQWLGRHQDYARAGITDVWLWHHATWVPRVLFAHQQSGWILDLDDDRIGLIHAQPGPASGNPQAGASGCRDVHWPPCPDDQLAILWTPLASAQLAREGIKPSPKAAAHLATRAAQAKRPTATPATKQAAPLMASKTPGTQRAYPLPVAMHGTPDAWQQYGQTPQPHDVFRYDAFPPWTDPDAWCFYCEACGRSFNGAEIKGHPDHSYRPCRRPLTSGGQ